MKNILPTFILCLGALASQPSIAAEYDNLFPADSRIRILPYDESDIYTIPTKYGFQTHIVFGADEQIETISMGDRSLWQMIPSANRLFIRPMIDDVTTNMTVITNKRSYQFDIKSVGEDDKNTSIVYVAKFVYPDQVQESNVSAYDAQIESIENVFPDAVSNSPTPMPYIPSVPEPTATPAPITAPVTVQEQSPLPATSRQTNNAYSFAGPDELAPVQVYDDGKSTYFKYRDMGQPLPNAYVVEQDGREKPVGHYVKDGLMVIDELAGEWLLKNSAGTVVVYNEVLNPAKE